jgi:uridine kinase
VSRPSVLDTLIDLVVQAQRPHTVRVAIDGPDAAGKTTLADELATAVAARGRPVIRASVDDFHRPRAARYRRGRFSPAGFYLDSFDYEALRSELLEPLGPDGDAVYRTAVFDVRLDAPVAPVRRRAEPGSVLIVDGVFLLRPELDGLWDLRVVVEVERAEALRRALARDVPWLGSADEMRELYKRRYFPGQDLYRRLVDPRARADVVIESQAAGASTLDMWTCSYPDRWTRRSA